MAPNQYSSSQHGNNRMSNWVASRGRQLFGGGLNQSKKLSKNNTGITVNVLHEHYHSSPQSPSTGWVNVRPYKSKERSDDCQAMQRRRITTTEGDIRNTDEDETYGSATSSDEELEEALDEDSLFSLDTSSIISDDLHRIDNPREGAGKLRIRTHRAVAVTSWLNWNIRAYIQDSSCYIREVCQMVREDGAWNMTPVHVGILDAKQDTPLAVISRNSGAEIHLYYISIKNKLYGWFFSKATGHWSRDPINESVISVSPHSNLAAVESSTGIRVYYQSTDENIYECFLTSNTHPLVSPSWESNPIGVKALPGSALAATAFSDEGRWEVRLYYQQENLKVYERAWDAVSGWQDGSLPAYPAQRHTTLAATSWAEPSPQIRIYLRSTKSAVESHDGESFLELICTGEKWDRGSFKLAAVPGDTQLAVIQQLGGAGQGMRAYFVGKVVRDMWRETVEWVGWNKIDRWKDTISWVS